MRIYHTETQEDYDALMKELEKKDNGRWDWYRGNTVVLISEKDSPTFTDLETVRKLYPPITITKSTAKKKEKVANSPYCQNKNDKVLYQKWYKEYDKETFRAIMLAIAEQYISWYEHKNGIEDLQKGIYTLERLRDYEEESE